MSVIIDNNEEIVNSIREIYRVASPLKLRELIAKHFIPSIEEKKNYSEIPTPVKELVDPMLELIPSEFWTQSHSVFEPCCGKGNFVLGIFDKFYKGLETLIPDKKERCRVIITKCIYYADITSTNVFITTELLKCHVESYCGEKLELTFNSHVGDTLVLNVGEKWGLEVFDAVIGNPPYQKNTNNKGRGHTLWNLFVECAINEWLIDDGYLLFVHPRGWRQIKNKTGILMRQYQLVYLNMNNIKKGKSIFKCSTDYDYYLLQKTPVYKNTIINDYMDKQYECLITNDMKFIPNHSVDEVMNLIDEEDPCNFIHNSLYAPMKKWMSKEQNEEYKYPCVYSINAKNIVSLKWSRVNDKGHFGIKKLVFSNGQGYVYDKDGIYGLTEWAYAIPCDETNFREIETAFLSERFRNIIDAIKLTADKYNYNIIKMFKKNFWKECGGY